MTGPMIAYKKTSQRNAPSADKGDVGKWIIAPAWLATFCGMSAGLGIAMALTAQKDIVFIIGLGMFGGGMSGLVTIMLKSLSFDRDGIVSWTEETPIVYQSDDTPRETISGNVSPMIPMRTPHTVKNEAGEYTFSTAAMNAFMSRVSEGNMQVSRDEAKLESVLYESTIKRVMAEAGYWRIEGRGQAQRAKWTNDGRDWLYTRMRDYVPPTLP